jgi:hypothetical protein
MAKIAILDDSPEVVAVLTQAVSAEHHEIMRMIHESQFMVQSAIDFEPDVIIVPLHRSLESRSRPISDYRKDILGIRVLETVCAAPELKGRPIIVFGFYITLEDLPGELRDRICYNYFLTFPLGLQDLNPTITGLVKASVPPKADDGA